MATNVLELRRPAGACFSGHLLREASVTDQTGIAPAAAAIARAASEHGPQGLGMAQPGRRWNR